MKKFFLLISSIAFSVSLHAQLNVAFRSNLPYPGKTLSNIWGYVDSLGNEYALVGTSTGVSIVDVTNPSAPVERFAIVGNTSSWREIKTWQKYAYVTTEATSPNTGIMIVDLSNLPASINTKYWKGTGAINNLLNKAHALHVEAGYLYLYGSNLFGGAAIIASLADPWNPVYTGYCNGNYVHDGYVRNDTLYAAHIYQGYYGVWNVANKAAPVLVQTQSTPNVFTHNDWLTDNSRILLTTDEVSDSYLASYDVSDVSNIIYLDKIQSQNPGSGSIVHNTHVTNDYAVSSYYRDGITIVDASRKGNLVLVGWYDTSPLLSGNGFNGCWGVYPFLPSGTLVCSDMENGLYVLTPTYVRACYLEGLVKDSMTNIPLINVSVKILTTSVSENTLINGQYKTGTPVAGTYTVQFSKPGYYPKTVSNVVLSNGVLTTLNIQLVEIPKMTITGLVRDNITLLPVSNANVKFENVNGTYNAVTNISGNFSIANAYEGTYNITAGKWTYRNTCMNATVTNVSPNVIIDVGTGYYDDFTFNYNWTVVGNATSGAWVRGVPVGTTYTLPNDCNPGTDVGTDCSNLCYVTGNGGGANSLDDLDNGYTQLTSPTFDISSYANAYVNFSRWFIDMPGTGNGNDTLRISLNNGISTVTLENVLYNTAGNSSWVSRSLKVSSYLPPTNNMKMIVYSADINPGHIVEAGFDFFEAIDAGSGLPVELVSFSGYAEKEFNLLQWVTASEKNNSGFEAERSYDGINFQKIGFVKGAGNSTTEQNYSFRDLSYTQRESYYRLKQTDIDGHFQYSTVIAVRRINDSPLTIYPNPVNDFLTISFSDFTGSALQIKVCDMLGKEICSKTFPANKNSYSLSLPDFNLQKGLYLVKVSGNGQEYVSKFLKQ